MQSGRGFPAEASLLCEDPSPVDSWHMFSFRLRSAKTIFSRSVCMCSGSNCTTSSKAMFRLPYAAQSARTPISALCAGEGRPEVLLLVSYSSCTLASHSHSPLVIWDSDAQMACCPDLARDADFEFQSAVDVARLSLNHASFS